ncbi:MAG: TldD/PmbA family protein [Proteobacteria bacterium]|nr:TldD/PmbA family protein [Pseudomonadota bacterium]
MFEADFGAVLETALTDGGDLAEVFVERVRTMAVVGEEGRIEKVLGGRDQGLGVRLLHDHRSNLAYGNEFSGDMALRLARDVAQAGSGQGRPPVRMGKPQTGRGFEIELDPDGVETARKVDVVKEAAAAAKGHDPRVRQVRVTYGDRVQEVLIVNSDGVHVSDVRYGILLAVQVVAEDRGVIQTAQEIGGGFEGFEVFGHESPTELALKAARRAVMMLGADPAPSGRMPVVLWSSAGGTMIHEAVGHGLEADLAGEGLSVYTDRLGRRVASPLITVVDDATLPHRRGSFSFDDEGVPAQRTVLVDQGVLESYMVDRMSGLRYGYALTGNGRRESYRHVPICRMTNTLIAPGEDDPESILKNTPEGLLVKKMGGGQVNTVNGDFVFEVAEGYLIENGAQGRPVRGATLAGNGPLVLMSIDRLGRDLGFAIGTCGKDGQGSPVADAQPTLRIPDLVVGGTGAQSKT